FIEQLGVLRIEPSGAVVAAARVVQTQERERVHVVSAPPVARDSLILEFSARIEKGFLLHWLNRNRDAEVLLPLCLDEFSNQQVGPRGIHVDLDLVNREFRRLELSGSIAVSGIGQEGLRFVRLEWIAFGLRVPRKL